MKTRHIQHLYHRTGFGILPTRLNKLSKFDKKKIVNDLFADSKKMNPLQMDLPDLQPLLENNKVRSMNKKELRELRKISREKIKEYNYDWIHRLTTSNQILREKMTLFWANVFVCKDNHIFHVQQYNNTLRKYALGDLRQFIKAIAKEAAMIKYLNNRQNVKAKPNENFARELMELFTLGTGQYTEQDIKESARAFTGWAFKPNGDFYLRVKKHDTGSKTFLGKTGHFDGDDIIDIILEQKQCARFISEKIYKYFVNPEVSEARLNEMTDILFKDYKIDNLVRYVLMSDWFYEETNISAKIKSPIELFVGIQRIVPLAFEKQKQLLYLQKVMGQILLDPPNVAGWMQDKNWIDSNTLMFRMKLPAFLLNDAVINVDQKGAFEDSFEAYYDKTRNRNRRLKINRDWSIFNNEFSGLNFTQLKENLIMSKIDRDTETFLSTLSNKNKKEYLVQLMSLPEYQLC